MSDIRTRRLIVRPFEFEDFGPWKSAFSSLHEPTNEFDLGPKPASQLNKRFYRKVCRFYRECEAMDRSYNFGMFRKTDSALVGFVNLLEIRRDIYQTALIGWGVFTPHQRNGYAKEGVRAGLKHGFRGLGLHKVEAYIEPTNRRSIKLAKSIGMSSEGTRRSQILVDRQWRDIRCFSMLAKEL